MTGGGNRIARGAPPNSDDGRSVSPDRHHFAASRIARSPFALGAVAVVAALTLALPADAPRAAAPDSAAPRVAACDSIVAAARAADGRLTVSAYLTRADGVPLSDSTTDRLLLPIVNQLDFPTPLRLPMFAPAPTRLRAFRPADGDSPSLRSPALSAVYGFTLQRDGKIRDVAVRLAALAPGVDSAVLRAIGVAGSLGGLAEADGALVPRGGLELLLRVSAGVAAPGEGRPLFRSPVGLFAITDAVPPDSIPTPEYPRAEEESGWDGHVLLQFAVDPTGRPAMETVELLQATTIGFARAALDVLPKVRFRPARVGACPVWQLVRLPFDFHLPDDGG